MTNKIHENFLQFPDLVEARNRAENALIEYDKIGDVRCTNRGYGPFHLCVNVKVRRYPLHCAPEIREDMQERFYDMQVHDFWNFDFDGDCIAPDHCKYEFPKFFSEGRSGGYFCFDSSESKRGGTAIRAFKENDGTVDTALSGWDDVVDPFRWITDVRDFGDDEKKRDEWIKEDVENVTNAYTEMAEFFESAIEWVKVVQACMEYRLDVYEGKSWEGLEHLEANQMFEFFDYSACMVEVMGDDISVYWPQHARVWKDRGEWVVCDKDDPDAIGWQVPEGEPAVWKKFVPGAAQPYRLDMKRDDLVEQFNEDLAEAVKAIRKRAIKS